MFSRYLGCLVFLPFVALVSGCDQSEDIADEPAKIESQYSVWASSQKVSPFDMSERLKQNLAAADDFCAQDEGRPADYSKHIGLICTHETDRIDLIDKYDMDTTKPITYGDTNNLLAENLGKFVAQEGTVSLSNEEAITASTEELKLTFSRAGRFTGYCEQNSGYTSVIQVERATGAMRVYSTRCTNPTALVCMSMRE